MVAEALLAIQDDSWAHKYRHVDDVTNPNAVIMFVEDELVLVWRVIAEYPDWYRVIFLGHPDDQA